MAKNKSGIEDIKTFAAMAKFLMAHEDIQWEWGKEKTIQANYREGEKRYRIKVFLVKEKGGARSIGINFHGGNFIGHTASPLWWNYRYGVIVYLGKDEVINLSGKSDSVMSESATRVLAEHKGGSYLPRSDFIELWETLLMRIKV
jgi:hypothetical protein